MRNKSLKLYAWTGLAYFALWLAVDMLSQNPPFLPALINSIWFSVYLTFINFFFFEKIASRLFYYPVALLLLSAGLYAWRVTGIALHLYTPLKTFRVAEGIIYVAPHGLLSLLFFGLVKNQYEHQRLKQVVGAWQSEKRTPVRDHILITVQKKKVKLRYAAIIYIESQREYVKIVTAQQQYLSKISTREIEAQLPPELFRRVHRSFIVSLSHVESFTADTIQVDGYAIPVGRAYRKVLNT